MKKGKIGNRPSNDHLCTVMKSIPGEGGGFVIHDMDHRKYRATLILLYESQYIGWSYNKLYNNLNHYHY